MNNVSTSLIDSSLTLFTDHLIISTFVDSFLMSFHIQLNRGKKDQMKEIPKGSFAVMVGRGEEQQKFIVPVMYIYHPLFTKLLKEAEEEYGFNHQGVISIPCHVHHFRNVQSLIDKDTTHHHLWCFRAP